MISVLLKDSQYEALGEAWEIGDLWANSTRDSPPFKFFSLCWACYELFAETSQVTEPYVP